MDTSFIFSFSYWAFVFWMCFALAAVFNLLTSFVVKWMNLDGYDTTSNTDSNISFNLVFLIILLVVLICWRPEPQSFQVIGVGIGASLFPLIKNICKIFKLRKERNSCRKYEEEREKRRKEQKE